jgi:alpha-L-rhamnosidase
MYEHLAGIKPDPDQPGFKRVLMCPEIPSGLDHVRAIHNSPYGRIVSQWRRDGLVFTWQVRLPPNTTATLLVPGRLELMTEGGKPLARSRDLRGIKQRGSRVSLEVGSGQYEFRSVLGQ